MDTPTAPMNTDNNNNNGNNGNNNRRRTAPARTKQSAYQGFGPKPIHEWNGERYQKATSPAHAQLIRNIREKFNEELAAPQYYDGDDDDDDDNNNDDVNCFPQQDKQPVLPPPDVSPTDTLRPSLIESATPNDDNDDDSTVIHDNRYYDNDDDDDDDNDDDDDDTYLAYSDDADYNFDYNNLLDADDGDDNDDDDDDSYTYCSTDENGYYNNTPNVTFDMHGNQFTTDDNDNVVPYDDKTMTFQAVQRQINAILAGCTTASSIKEFTNQAKRKRDDFFLPKKTSHAAPVTPSSAPTMYANDNHDAFLQHRWNNANKNNKPTVHLHKTKTKKTCTKHQRLLVTKDDTSVTPTLETICTLDTSSSHHNENEDTILMPSLVLRFGITQSHSTKYRSDPTPATDPNIPVLQYNMI